MEFFAMQASAEEAAGLLKAIANRNRLLVLCALVSREHTVGELAVLTGLSQSAISQHLARLRESGIVETRRDGQRIFYSVHKAEVRAVLETLHGIYCPEA